MDKELEIKILKDCCELNENLTLTVREDETIFVYKSRFLAVDFKRNFIVIDEPSPDSPDARPLEKKTLFEGFFQYKVFRYLYNSWVLDRTLYNFQGRKIRAYIIRMPDELKDGDRREYFRVQTKMRPPIQVTFHIYEKDSASPIMSSLVENTPKEFRAEIIDISGGGFSMRTKPGDQTLLLDKGDIIDARFKLQGDDVEMTLWSEVRNSRKYRDTPITIWGLQFLGSDRNRNIKIYRNKIMRYVTNRQREILTK